MDCRASNMFFSAHFGILTSIQLIRPLSPATFSSSNWKMQRQDIATHVETNHL